MNKINVRYTVEQADQVADALYAASQDPDSADDTIFLETESARLRNLAARARQRAARNPAA